MTTAPRSTAPGAPPAPPPAPLIKRFALFAFFSLIAMTLLWSKVTPWLSYPVAVVSHIALEQVAPIWVRTVHKEPGKLTLDTSVSITLPTGGKGDVVLEADPGRYAYGLPIVWALLLAAWGAARLPGLLGKAVLGYLLLLPAQAFSLVMYLLMELATAARLNVRTLRIDTWQLESIVFGYQLGVLVLPTLMPVLVWLLLDRRFFTEVIVYGWQQSLKRKPRTR